MAGPICGGDEPAARTHYRSKPDVGKSRLLLIAERAHGK